jgi:hypothetical protein
MNFNVTVPHDFLLHRKAIILAFNEQHVPDALPLLGIRYTDDIPVCKRAVAVRGLSNNIIVCTDNLVLLEPVLCEVPLIIVSEDGDIYVYRADYHKWPELPDVTNSLIGYEL